MRTIKKHMGVQPVKRQNIRDVKNYNVTYVYMPLWEKSYLTLEEASEYCGIGISKLRELTNEDGCNFVLFNGTKRLINRKKLDLFLDGQYSI